MNFQKQKNHLNGCLEPQGGLDVRTARSAIKSKSNHRTSQFVHVLQNTILLFSFLFVRWPGGEPHGVVGSVGREDVARVVASEDGAGGNTQVFPH